MDRLRSVWITPSLEPDCVENVKTAIESRTIHDGPVIIKRGGDATTVGIAARRGRDADDGTRPR